MNQEILRKGIHSALALFFAFSVAYFGKTFTFAAVSLLFGVFLFLRFVNFQTPMHTVSRISYGELFFPLGVAGSLLLALPNIALFQTAMLVLAVADPLAALIGQRFGKHHFTVFGELRSLEGSLACAISSLVIFLLYGGSFHGIVLATLVLTAVEAFALRGSDNLFLPLGTVLLFQLIP